MDIPQDMLGHTHGRLASAISALSCATPSGLPASRQFDHRQGYKAAVVEVQRLAARADEVISQLVEALRAAREPGAAGSDQAERIAAKAMDTHRAFQADNAAISARAEAASAHAGWPDAATPVEDRRGIGLPALPPYVYGRETGVNEKLYPVERIERWRDEVLAAFSSSALESARAQFPVEQVRWWAEALKGEPQVGAINGALVIAMLVAFADVLEQSGSARGPRWLENAIESFLRTRGYDRHARHGEAPA